jgi:hypothetical protein
MAVAPKLTQSQPDCECLSWSFLGVEAGGLVMSWRRGRGEECEEDFLEGYGEGCGRCTEQLPPAQAALAIKNEKQRQKGITVTSELSQKHKWTCLCLLQC